MACYFRTSVCQILQHPYCKGLSPQNRCQGYPTTTDCRIQAGIYLCHKYSGAKLKEIGEQFGIGESAVSQASRRFAQELGRDKKLRTFVEKMVADLGCQECRSDT